jgi:hypothetical protein
MPARLPTNDQALEALRVRRADLRESMSALEHALAAPAPGRLDAWTERVHVALVELFSDFREHIAIAEGPNGVYRGVLSSTPRLSSEVVRLTRDHAEINDLIDHLLNSVSAAPLNAGVDGVRDLGVRSDSVDSHGRFASRHQLPFVLLSDKGAVVRKRYGVPTTLGILPGRVTYVIDRNGTVRHIFSSMANIDQHVDDALAVVRQLQTERTSP